MFLSMFLSIFTRWVLNTTNDSYIIIIIVIIIIIIRHYILVYQDMICIIYLQICQCLCMCACYLCAYSSFVNIFTLLFTCPVNRLNTPLILSLTYLQLSKRAVNSDRSLPIIAS